MNLVNIIGQLEGDAEIAYTSKDGTSKLYKFVVRVPNISRNKSTAKKDDDLITIKAWSNVINDEFALHDQAIIGIEGKIHSSQNKDTMNIFNEIYANRVLYLN